MAEHKYSYLQGIAEWCAQATPPMTLSVNYGRESHCQYCGAEIIWRFYVADSTPAPNTREIMVGSECVHKFEKYMGTESSKLQEAMRYFEKYQALARKAKIFPEAKVELKNLDKEMRVLKAAAEEVEKKKKLEAHKNPIQREPMDKLRSLVEAGAKEFMGTWEKSFADSVLEQYFSYMHTMSPKQLDIVKRMNETYGKMDFSKVAEIKAEAEKLKRQLQDDAQFIMDTEIYVGNRHAWVQGIEPKETFIDSLRNWVSDGKLLTERQRAAVNDMVKREDVRREKLREIDAQKKVEEDKRDQTFRSTMLKTLEGMGLQYNGKSGYRYNFSATGFVGGFTYLDLEMFMDYINGTRVASFESWKEAGYGTERKDWLEYRERMAAHTLMHGEIDFLVGGPIKITLRGERAELVETKDPKALLVADARNEYLDRHPQQTGYYGSKTIKPASKEGEQQ